MLRNRKTADSKYRRQSVNKNGGHGNEFDEFDSGRAGKKIKAKEVTVEAAVREALEAVRAKEEQVHSFVTVDEEGALARAKEVQAQIDAGELTGPLAGVPVAIKDNMCTEGLLTTCSSKILYNFIPTYTAEAVKKLEEAGAVIIGKTNMDEFAMGSTTETSAYGETKIHGIPHTFREDLPAVPVQLWQQRSVPLPLVLIPAVPFVSRVLSVE